MLDISQDLTTVETDVWFHVAYGGSIYATDYHPVCPANPSAQDCVPGDIFGPFKMSASVPKALIDKMTFPAGERKADITLAARFEPGYNPRTETPDTRAGSAGDDPGRPVPAHGSGP